MPLNSPSISSIQNLIVTGAKFLVLRPQASTNFDLPGLKLGVLPNTTTEAFVRETYPRADIVTFSGAEDRQQAVQAVISGQIDAFIGDSLLSEAELAQQNLPRDQFALVPGSPSPASITG